MKTSELLRITKKCFSYKFYQRISPSAKIIMLKHDIKDFPTNIKFITKEVILNFMEKLEKDKKVSQDTTSLWKEQNKQQNNKIVVEEKPANNFKNVSVENNSNKTLNTNVKAQGYMTIKINLENTIIDLNLKFDDLKSKNQSIEKLINFTKKAAIKCSNKFKELNVVDFDKNSR